MILKKDDDADDDSSEVEENPELADDEVWLHSKNEQHAYKKKKTVQFKVHRLSWQTMAPLEERTTCLQEEKDGPIQGTVRHRLSWQTMKSGST